MLIEDRDQQAAAGGDRAAAAARRRSRRTRGELPPGSLENAFERAKARLVAVGGEPMDDGDVVRTDDRGSGSRERRRASHTKGERMDEYGESSSSRRVTRRDRPPRRARHPGGHGARRRAVRAADGRYPQRYAQQQPQVTLRACAGHGRGHRRRSGVFGRMTTGQVIDMVAQIFAALMPLPARRWRRRTPTTDVGQPDPVPGLARAVREARRADPHAR